MNFIKNTTKRMYRSLRVWPVLTLCGVMLLWTGCNTEDFLTPEPATFTSTGNYFTQASHYEAALASAYNGLRGWASTNSGDFRIATEIRADAINRQFDINLPGIDFQNVVSWFMQPSNDVGIGLWQNMYGTIYRANTVITRIDDLDDSLWEAGQKARVLGEAMFIRAVSYYHLINLYGDVDGSGVPLRSAETASPGDAAVSSLASRDAILSFIVTDLQAAAAALPSSTAAGYVNGRASSGAASYMLGKTLLMTGDYSGAITALSSLSADYSLLADQIDVFDPTNNYNDESIFELSYVLNTPGQPERNPDRVIPHHYQDIGVMDALEPGLSVQYDGSNSGMFPSFEALSLFDPVNDERYTQGLTISQDPSNTAYPGVSQTATDDGPGGGVGTEFIPTMNKWWFPASLEANDEAIAGNEVIMRYADAVLALAEAEWRDGDDAAAVGYLNQIRNRSNLANTSVATLDADYPIPGWWPASYLDADDTGRAIWIERTREMLGEGHRIYDLQRFSRYDGGTLDWAQGILQAQHSERLANESDIEGQTAISITAAEIPFPIPPTEILNSEGDIQQNSGY